MRSICFCAGLLLATSPAMAEDTCGPLKIAGQTDILSGDGVPVIAATANGQPIKLIFDTGGYFMELSAATAKTLNLSLTPRRYGMMDIAGNTFNKTATVSDFEIGSVKARDVPFMVTDDDYGDLNGLMGPKLVQVVDVDIDFTAKKINFVLQDHCEGKVVYWKTPSYAVVPFVLSEEGHVRMPIELDGVKLTALLDTGSSKSYINTRTADRYFNLTEKSPEVTKTEVRDGDKKVKKYSHTFKTLTIGGITFNNPTLGILPDLLRNHLINAHKPHINSLIDTNNDAEGLDDLIVGMEQLHRFHIYIAYKEKKLYISLDSPPAQDAADASH